MNTRQNPQTKGAARMTVIALMFMAATMAAIMSPEDMSWVAMVKFTALKTVAVGLFLGCFRLYKRWRQTDRWVMAFDRAGKEMER